MATYSLKNPQAVFDDLAIVVESVPTITQGDLTIKALKDQLIEIDKQLMLWDLDRQNKTSEALAKKQEISDKIQAITIALSAT